MAVKYLHLLPDNYLLLDNSYTLLENLILATEVQKVVNPVILNDRKFIQNQGLAENIFKTVRLD